MSIPPRVAGVLSAWTQRTREQRLLLLPHLPGAHLLAHVEGARAVCQRHAHLAALDARHGDCRAQQQAGEGERGGRAPAAPGRCLLAPPGAPWRLVGPSSGRGRALGRKQRARAGGGLVAAWARTRRRSGREVFVESAEPRRQMSFISEPTLITSSHRAVAHQPDGAHTSAAPAAASREPSPPPQRARASVGASAPWRRARRRGPRRARTGAVRCGRCAPLGWAQRPLLRACLTPCPTRMRRRRRPRPQRAHSRQQQRSSSSSSRATTLWTTTSKPLSRAWWPRSSCGAPWATRTTQGVSMRYGAVGVCVCVGGARCARGGARRCSREQIKGLAVRIIHPCVSSGQPVFRKQRCHPTKRGNDVAVCKASRTIRLPTDS